MSGPDTMKGAEAVKEVDRHSADINDALDSYGQIYKKHGEMRVRFAVEKELEPQYEALSDADKTKLAEMKFDPAALKGKTGELLITRLANGQLETPNVLSAGNPIVINPGGEEYAPKPDEFAKRYEPKKDEAGVYVAKGYCVAVKNPFQKPISMKAVWNEMQNGAANCMIADTYDYATGERGGEPYIIGREEFEQTYKAH